MKKIFIVSLCLILCLSVFFFPVSASSVITDSVLSFNMAFIGSSGTGLGYYTSGYKPILGNESYTLTSDLSSGAFNSSSFVSTVVNIKKTDDSFLFLAGEKFNFVFNKFHFAIEIPRDDVYDCEEFKEIRIDLIFDDNTTKSILPNFEFDNTGSVVLTGSANAEKNVKEIKLDFIFSPYSALNFNGNYEYYYFMFCPPSVLFDVISRDSQMLEDIDSSLDNAINGEVDAKPPVNSTDFDDLHDTENELMDNVQNYLDDGIGFFDNAVGSIMGVANGFQAIKLLTAPVFNLPFANDIILVSVSLGLIGSLLGLVSVGSSNINKKSDLAKRSKAYKEGYRAGFTKKNDKG